ncbi:MAG: hypothetical protein LBE49_01915 [Deltaproteobacteria bacterium]|jgi:hypothetical protein|nr:hypothetical protein [Deltaproteobacteria bacterium]
MSASPTRKTALTKLALLCLLIALALAVLILPGKLIEGLLNQDFDDPDFAYIRTEETKLAPFLDSLSLKGVSLALRQTPDNPLTIGEISVTGLARWPLFKALFGFGGDLAKVLGQGKVIARDVTDHGTFGAMERLRLGSLTLTGLSLDLPEGGQSPSNLDYITLSELRATDVDLLSNEGQAFKSDSLAVFNLEGSVVGGLLLSGTSLDRNGEVFYGVGNLSVSGVRLSALARALTADRTLTRALAIINSFNSLDLASLDIRLAGEPAVFLKKALIDTSQGDSARPTARVCDLSEATLHLGLLFAPEIQPPVTKAILESLGEEVTATLSVRGAADGASTLRLDVADKAVLNLTLETKGLSAQSMEGPLLLTLPSASLGDGRLELLDKGLARDLLPALAVAIGPIPGAPQGESPPAPLTEATPLPPLPGDYDDPLGDSDLLAAGAGQAPAAGSAIGAADSLLGQSAAQSPPGPALPAAAEPAIPFPAPPEAPGAVQAPPAPRDGVLVPNAPRTLLAAFESFLTTLEDPDPNRAVLNFGIISLEAARFLESPEVVAVRWEPLKPGFPQNLIDRTGGLAALFSELTSGGLDWQSLAAKYKYDIIQCLNPSLEVNSRAPVAVYLPPSGAAAP